MRRLLFIFLLCMGVAVLADDYVDDLYYSERTALEEELNSGTLTPYYNKKQMQELVFVTDSLPTQSADTIPAQPK